MKTSRKFELIISQTTSMSNCLSLFIIKKVPTFKLHQLISNADRINSCAAHMHCVFTCIEKCFEKKKTMLTNYVNKS